MKKNRSHAETESGVRIPAHVSKQLVIPNVARNLLSSRTLLHWGLGIWSGRSWYRPPSRSSMPRVHAACEENRFLVPLGMTISEEIELTTHSGGVKAARRDFVRGVSRQKKKTGLVGPAS
jgi:hypothetical protein